MVFLGLYLFLSELEGILYDITTDPALSTWMLLIFILAFLVQLALIITQAVLVYKLVKRRDEHFKRDALLRQGIIEYLDANSIAEQKDINVERWTMNTIDIYCRSDEHERSPATWGVLVGVLAFIPLIGIIFLLYALYFLSKDPTAHEDRQIGFNQQLQISLMKLGKQPLNSIQWAPLPRRSTSVYVILSILTLGFFLPYWWYVVIRDMNDHLAKQWRFENELVEMLQRDG